MDDMVALTLNAAVAWLVVGDFSLICLPCEKNNGNFDARCASKFNALINSLALHELHLSDRLFTWTNRQTPPILARLDRAFFDNFWNAAFPDSVLSSLPRATSDHVPLLVMASTTIPKPSHFYFEDTWLTDPLFLPSTLPSWTGAVRGTSACGALSAKKKAFSSAAKAWKKRHRFIPTFDNDCRLLIMLMDFWEE